MMSYGVGAQALWSLGGVTEGKLRSEIETMKLCSAYSVKAVDEPIPILLPSSFYIHSSA